MTPPGTALVIVTGKAIYKALFSQQNLRLNGNSSMEGKPFQERRLILVLAPLKEMNLLLWEIHFFK